MFLIFVDLIIIIIIKQRKQRHPVKLGTADPTWGDSSTNHVLVNLWLTLYKLTGWLASLDTTKCIGIIIISKI